MAFEAPFVPGRLGSKFSSWGVKKAFLRVKILKFQINKSKYPRKLLQFQAKILFFAQKISQNFEISVKNHRNFYSFKVGFS